MKHEPTVSHRSSKSAGMMFFIVSIFSSINQGIGVPMRDHALRAGGSQSMAFDCSAKD
jgi:hypothetical protein